MPNKSQLLINLSQLQNKRLGVEAKAYQEMFYGAYNKQFVEIIKDNWECDEEMNKRFPQERQVMYK